MGFARAKQIALILGTSLLLGTTFTPPAHADTSLTALFEEHHDKYDDFFPLEISYVKGGYWFGHTVRTHVWYYGCPADRPRVPDEYSTSQHAWLAQRMVDAKAECWESSRNLIAAVERESWSLEMEAVATKNVIVGSTRKANTDTWEQIRQPIAKDIVARKRKEYLAKIASSNWSTALEAQAALIKPYVSATDWNNAVSGPRDDAIGRLVGNNEWSPEWEQRLLAEPIARYAHSSVNHTINLRFRKFLKKFKIESTPWSLDFENQVKEAINGAGSERKNYALDLLEQQQTATIHKIQGDGQAWSPEWDRRIAPLAERNRKAKDIQIARRQAFVREVTSHQPWGEVLDRQLQAFVEDSVSLRVKLSRETIAEIDSWRSRAINNGLQHREWSLDLEREYSYLTLVYPKAQQQIDALRKKAAVAAEKDINTRGWNLESDAVFGNLAQVQYNPFGIKQEELRKKALEKSSNVAWSPSVDERLTHLGRVYPAANDVLERKRRKAFDEVSNRSWSESVDAKLRSLAEAGFKPANDTLDQIRAEKLAQLESAAPTPERDIELAKLAAVYPPARANSQPSETTPVAPADPTDMNQAEGTETGTGKVTPDKKPSDTEATDSTQKPEKSDSSSTSNVKETFGIIVAVITGISAIVGALMPLIKRFVPNIPWR